MGESPKESASGEFANMVQGMLNRRGDFGQVGALSQYSSVKPIFERGREDLRSSISGARDNLNLGLSTQMTGIGQQLGEGLISSGVPGGHGRGTAFAASMSPAIAANQNAQAQLGITEGVTLADISKTEGMTLADIMKAADAISAQLLGAKAQGISGMKDSTTFGDILGTVRTFAEIIGAIFGTGGISPGGGGDGGGGDASEYGQGYGSRGT